MSNSDIEKIKNNVLYYYNTFGKDLIVLNTEQSFNIKKEFYRLSRIIDLIYQTKDGKIGILDYKNTDLISKQYIKNYIKQVYTYFIGLKDVYNIDELAIYAIKSRKMIHINLEEKSLEILLEELDTVSQNIQREVFECNINEDCANCTFSNICIHSNNESVSVYEFNKDMFLGFRNKFYENLPDYKIIDYGDEFYKDKEFINDGTLYSDSNSLEDSSISKFPKSDGENITDNVEEVISDSSFDDFKASDGKSDLNFNFSSFRFKSKIYSNIDAVYEKYSSFLKEEVDINSLNLLEYDESLSEEENIVRKYVLKKKGKNLFRNENYNESKDYFKKLINNSYFKEDYYPYKYLILSYHKLKRFNDEKDALRAFFKSNIYCNKYHFLYFKYLNRKIRKKLRIKHKEFQELVKGYENVIKNHSDHGCIPNADRIIKNNKGIKIISETEEFYNHTKDFYINIASGLYDDKLNQEAFDLYGMGIYRYHNRSYRHYQRLVSIYRRTKNYKHELLVILEYFHRDTNVYRTKNGDQWFKKRLETTMELIGDENVIGEIKSIPVKKGYNFNENYELNYLKFNLDSNYKLTNLEKELNYDLDSDEDIFTVFK